MIQGDVSLAQATRILHMRIAFLWQTGIGCSRRRVKKVMPATKKAKPLTTDGVRQYLCEIGRIPLLQPNEEIELARLVTERVKLEEIRDRLEETLDREPSQDEWRKAANIDPDSFNRILERGLRAKKKMVESNLRLVVSVAKKYQNRGLDLLQLIQEGNMGLQRATEKFDVEKGYKFSTYAYWWIRQAITRAIANDARPIRNPIHVTEKINKIKKTIRELENQLGRPPRRTEVAAQMGMKPEDIAEILANARNVVSLSTYIGNEKDTELLDLIPDRRGEDDVSPDVKDAATELLASLSGREKEVIRLRFYGEKGEPMSLSQIGDKLELSRERIRQIEAKALRRLQATARRKKIRSIDVF